MSPAPRAAAPAGAHGTRGGAGTPRRPSLSPEDASGALRAIAAEAGLSSVRMVAWRDLDDPEAGGSELHAHRMAGRWAQAGLGVSLRTSAVEGAPRTLVRDGYRVERRGGRYGVFGRVMTAGLARRPVPGEGLVEVWNGMPFWSPLWYGGPTVVFLHHVHAEMWRMVLPAWMAQVGWATEHRLAPPVYRRTRVVTLSASSRDEIVDLLGLHPDRVSVVPPGVDRSFTPGGARSPDPSVVAVGRLVPIKRFDLLIEALAAARRRFGGLRAEIVGDGYERGALEARRDALGAREWLSLPGRLDQPALVERYRRAWVVASASLREGWGMTLSEAAACGTPAVATDIAGHRDSVCDGVTGVLAPCRTDALAAGLIRVLGDAALRERLGAAARQRAAGLTWEAAAKATLSALAEEAYWSVRRRGRPLGPAPYPDGSGKPVAAAQVGSIT